MPLALFFFYNFINQLFLLSQFSEFIFSILWTKTMLHFLYISNFSEKTPKSHNAAGQLALSFLFILAKWVIFTFVMIHVRKHSLFASLLVSYNHQKVWGKKGRSESQSWHIKALLGSICLCFCIKRTDRLNVTCMQPLPSWPWTNPTKKTGSLFLVIVFFFFSIKGHGPVSKGRNN